MTLKLKGNPRAAAEARAAVMRMRADLGQSSFETLRLLVTELVGNSVRHAAAKSVQLRARSDNGRIRVEVADEGPGFDPREEDPTASQESGWGLFLVDQLADRWGVKRDGRRTCVWFELQRA